MSLKSHPLWVTLFVYIWIIYISRIFKYFYLKILKIENSVGETENQIFNPLAAGLPNIRFPKNIRRGVASVPSDFHDLSAANIWNYCPGSFIHHFLKTLKYIFRSGDIFKNNFQITIWFHNSKSLPNFQFHNSKSFPNFQIV